MLSTLPLLLARTGTYTCIYDIPYSLCHMCVMIQFSLPYVVVITPHVCFLTISNATLFRYENNDAQSVGTLMTMNIGAMRSETSGPIGRENCVEMIVPGQIGE
jgi:hypothetical protein